MKHIIFTISLFLIIGTTYAQKEVHMGPHGKQMIEQEKIPFFTRKLDLTPNEAKAFWPLYDEYEKKKHDLLKQRKEIGHTIMKKDTALTEKEANELNIAYLKLESDEFELKKEYNEKFSKILPIQKVNKFFFAEYQFRIYLLKKLRKAHSQPPKHG